MSCFLSFLLVFCLFFRLSLFFRFCFFRVCFGFYSSLIQISQVSRVTIVIFQSMTYDDMESLAVHSKLIGQETAGRLCAIGSHSNAAKNASQFKSPTARHATLEAWKFRKQLGSLGWFYGRVRQKNWKPCSSRTRAPQSLSAAETCQVAFIQGPNKAKTLLWDAWTLRSYKQIL